jgi:hypothetical protein
MRRIATLLAAAVVVAVGAAGSAPASAQSPNCVDLYNRVMAVYQTAPLSPEYNQMAAAYGATCLGGAAAAAAYPSYYPQYYAPGYQPYYGYAEPDYAYYGGYGYGVPAAVGIGLGFGRGFHHGGDFREHGGFRGAGFRSGGGFHGGGGHGGGGHGGGGHGGGGHGGGGHGGGGRGGGGGHHH